MGSRAHIRVLPVSVANKIAAGEVVERPVSVTKELIENAVDAGASRIDVDIAGGGRRLVAVSDNGSGMSRDDALLSFERHATSKIADINDIEKIATLGFRGEALAAIAAVSRLRMKTCKVGEQAGTEIVIAGGKVGDVRETGHPPGTSVEVRDLFFNVPARRKFLRSHQTELSHIRIGFIVQALAHPDIGMVLRADGHETYRLAGEARLDDRLRDLFGPDYLEKLRRADHISGRVSVSGYVSLPSVSRSDRSEQYVFVNGRAVTAPLLGYAVREGYRTLLPKDRHPSVFLFVNMDPGLVDVNVHPTKKEVRFRHPGEIRDCLITSIRRALQSGRPDAAVLTTQPEPQAYPANQVHTRAARDIHLTIESLPPTRTFKYPRMPVAGQASAEHPASEFLPYWTREENGSSERTRELEDSSTPWVWCRVLGQVGSLYVVLETEDGFVLMDPHAAHERVLFERFTSAVLEGSVQTQSLLIPETVELGPKDAMHVRKNLDMFRQMGFGISEFGGDAFVVDALPSYFAAASGQSLLADIAQVLERAGTGESKGKWREESIAQAACRAAAKARDKLTIEEIEQLVIDLARAEMPYTCPHGRPTLIFTSFKELNRKFGRE